MIFTELFFRVAQNPKATEKEELRGNQDVPGCTRKPYLPHCFFHSSSALAPSSLHCKANPVARPPRRPRNGTWEGNGVNGVPFLGKKAKRTEKLSKTLILIHFWMLFSFATTTILTKSLKMIRIACSFFPFVAFTSFMVPLHDLIMTQRICLTRLPCPQLVEQAVHSFQSWKFLTESFSSFTKIIFKSLFLLLIGKAWKHNFIFTNIVEFLEGFWSLQKRILHPDPSLYAP